jgi:hypothetical protein
MDSITETKTPEPTVTDDETDQLLIELYELRENARAIVDVFNDDAAGLARRLQGDLDGLAKQASMVLGMAIERVKGAGK